MPLPDLIALDPEGDDVPAAADPRVARVLAYWRGLARPGRLPSRADLDPVALVPVLPFVSILDALEGGDFRFRLVGEALNDRYGVLKDRRLSEIMEGELLAFTLEEHGTCVRDRVAVFVRNTERTRGRLGDSQIFQRLLMPLAADGETVDALLVVMVFERR